MPKADGFVELCEQWETYLKKYQDLAKECGICIVPGTIVESHKGAEKEEDRLLNVAYFIDDQGQIRGKYVKKNLWYVAYLFEIISAAQLHQGARARASNRFWKRGTRRF
jgi:predicted amidohydrolase